MFELSELSNESLDAVLSLPVDAKTKYFTDLVEKYYPKVSEGEDYQNILDSYVSSFYVEKLYRSNRFFNEKFIPVYTMTGMIRNIIAESYYSDQDLLVH